MYVCINLSFFYQKFCDGCLCLVEKKILYPVPYHSRFLLQLRLNLTIKTCYFSCLHFPTDSWDRIYELFLEP